MSKYSIVNTTKEQRAKFVANAQAIAELSGTKITEEDKALAQRYIDGEIELETLQKLAVEKYTRN